MSVFIYIFVKNLKTTKNDETIFIYMFTYDNRQKMGG